MIGLHLWPADRIPFEWAPHNATDLMTSDDVVALSYSITTTGRYPRN